VEGRHTATVGNPSAILTVATTRRVDRIRLLAQQARQLGARADPELAVHVAQVELDGSGADEQLSRDLSVGQSLSDEPRHVELLLGELRGRRRLPVADGLARRPKLLTCPLGPGIRTHIGEDLQGGTEVGPGIDASPGSAEELTVREFGAGPVDLPQ
jgi:hypothetical protein